MNTNERISMYLKSSAIFQDVAWSVYDVPSVPKTVFDSWVYGVGANPVSCLSSHVRRPSSAALLFCHGSKSHFGSNGAINSALMESTCRLMKVKQL